MIAGVILAAAALVLIWVGGLAFTALAAAVSCLIFVEWVILTKAARRRWVRPLGLILVGASFGAAWVGAWGETLAGVLSVGAALAVYGVARGRNAELWTGLGLIYAIVPGLALAWLRLQPDGLISVLWVMVAVWGTDTFAYFAGRRFGGPKLAPRISPKKTWSGLIGGMAGAALGGWLVGWGFGLSLTSMSLLAGLAAVAAIIAQAGDLAESALKRAFDVKDSGSILPGHGGIMDRVDGLVTVVPLVALAKWYGLGIGALT